MQQNSSFNADLVEPQLVFFNGIKKVNFVYNGRYKGFILLQTSIYWVRIIALEYYQ